MNQIRRARRDDLEAVREIERRAGRGFAAIGMPEVAADEPLSVAALESFVAAGHAWVAVNARDRPVAYLLSELVDGWAHVEQVSVAPEHAGRGLGAALIDRLEAEAAAANRPGLTLTTFRDVPWNAPYYARLGFVALEAPELGPELQAVIQRESSSIPGGAPRVAMRRPARRICRAARSVTTK
ncbi:MAG: GNAT family N-acetyltransferase [Solirubrobacterales bacterium]|nr:GNAT family N-acetyltransferase [Solirubrobacterales bacterium]